MKKASITRLAEYARQMKLKETRQQATFANLVLTRETAEWLLADLAKRGKRIQQSVEDPNTCGARREKRGTELRLLASAVEAISNALEQGACQSKTD